MIDPGSQVARQRRCIARGRAYDLLGDLFRRGPVRLEHLATVDVLAPHLPETCDDTALALHHRVTGLELRPYGGLFLHPAGKLGGEVAGRARRFMVETGFSPDERDAEPDHLATELSFLAFLCAAEADAWADDKADLAGRLQARAHAFIDTHLLSWMAPFAVAVRTVGAPLYATAARLVIDLAVDHLGRSPTPPPLPVTEPLDLSHEKTGVRQIADHLGVPVKCGALLTPAFIRDVARKSDSATGFGSRSMRLENLIHTGARRGASADVLDRLVSRLSELAQELADTPGGEAWCDRLRHNISLVETMARAARAAGSEAEGEVAEE